jgi:hypothetical protein
VSSTKIKISTQKIEKLYDQVLTNLEKDEYIKREDIERFKTGNPSDFSQNVSKTHQILKNNKSRSSI